VTQREGSPFAAYQTPLMPTLTRQKVTVTHTSQYVMKNKDTNDTKLGRGIYVRQDMTATQKGLDKLEKYADKKAYEDQQMQNPASETE